MPCSPRIHLLRHIPCIVCDLPKPDLLHTMQFSILDVLPKWIVHFNKTREHLDMYNAIWLSAPAYHDLTPKHKSYEEVSQWNGKEIKEISQYLLGVVTQYLQGGNPTQRPIFHRSIEYTWALLDFSMYARYKSHDDATSSHMEDYLHCFHTFQDGLFLGRAGKKAKNKANALTTELVKTQKVGGETHAATWTPSKKWREMNTW